MLSDFHKVDRDWLNPMLDALCDALPFALEGDDERYQAEVLRLAPAVKADPRRSMRDSD